MPVFPHGLLQFCHSPVTQLENMREQALDIQLLNSFGLHLFDSWNECIRGGRAGLVVAVSDVSFRFNVGFVAEALVNHLTVNFSSAAISQILLPYSESG